MPDPSLPAHTIRGARCSFIERVLVDGGYRYDSLTVYTPSGGPGMVVDQVPLPGDTLSLGGQSGRTFVVIARDWTYPSAIHHAGEVPMPLVQVIVEASLGPLRDEATDPEG